ncbi:MAG: hypothetical protein ACE15C_21285 [Phycisphaerae bacterium]
MVTSIQSGYWGDDATWDSGYVPDLMTDDVAIASGHTVTVNYYDYLTCNHYLLVNAGGQLDIEGNLSIENGGSLDLYGRVNLYGFTNLYYGGAVNVYGELFVYSDLYMDQAYLSVTSAGRCTVYGYLRPQYGSSLDVQGVLTVESGGTIEANYNGYVNVQYGGTLNLYGFMVVVYGSTLYLYDHGFVLVAPSGGMVVPMGGTLSLDYFSRLDAFGYVTFYDYDSYLYLGYESVIRVARDISVPRMVSSNGGKIVMLRREGVIRDNNGNTLFVLDQAYGYGRTLVA